MALTYKQRLFVSFYLGESQGNATDAARRAGYRVPNVAGHRLLTKASISAAVAAKLDDAALTAGEILARLSEQASASIGDLVKVCGKGITFDLKGAKKTGKLRLVKKLKKTKAGWEVELYDAQAALVQLGKYHGLWVDRSEVSGPGGGPVVFYLPGNGRDDGSGGDSAPTGAAGGVPGESE